MIDYRDIGGFVGQTSQWMVTHDAAGDLLSDLARERLVELVGSAADRVASVPVGHLLKTRVGRLLNQVSGEEINDFTYASALDAMKQLSNDILIEFQRPVFLMIPDEKADYYLEPAPFGDDVLRAFPEAHYDITHAARCVALDEWTAVVMYSMRALEPALRHLGKKLKIKAHKTIDYQDWNVIIEGVEKAAKTMPTGKKAGAKAAQAKQFYSDIAAQFFFVKEAWRNPVMHANVKYDEPDAIKIYQHARSILQQLAAGGSP